MMERKQAGQMRATGERGPGGGGVGENRENERLVDTEPGLLRGTPGSVGDSLESTETREKAMTKGGRVGREGKSAVKGDPEKDWGRVEGKRRGQKREKGGCERHEGL